MRVIDPGHQYALAHLDGNQEELLTFVKREGEEYPGNRGSHPGTNMQEVIRALMDRTKYMNAQIRHPANNDVLEGLRDALFALEVRASERHGRPRPEYSEEFESLPVCNGCGHIGCGESH